MTFKEQKRKVIEEFEKKYLTALLDECNGNVTEAGAKSGIGRCNVYRLVKKYNVFPCEFRSSPTDQRLQDALESLREKLEGNTHSMVKQ